MDGDKKISEEILGGENLDSDSDTSEKTEKDLVKEKLRQDISKDLKIFFLEIKKNLKNSLKDFVREVEENEKSKLCEKEEIAASNFCKESSGSKTDLLSLKNKFIDDLNKKKLELSEKIKNLQEKLKEVGENDDALDFESEASVYNDLCESEINNVTAEVEKVFKAYLVKE